jgi:cytochrome oxidase Cu insertion factor (SCO1/SenC/PrrC family)
VVRAGLGALLALAVLAGGAGAGGDSVADLARELQLIPLDQPAPAFALNTLDGKRVALADFKGHVVLVYFWASW